MQINLGSSFSFPFLFPIILTGDPAAIEKGGISLFTKEFAPITEPFPILTPCNTTVWQPIQTSSSIIIFLKFWPCFAIGIFGLE